MQSQKPYGRSKSRRCTEAESKWCVGSLRVWSLDLQGPLQINKAGQVVYDASEPIRQTESYKMVAASVSEALEDVGSNTRYGGFIEKEARRRRREARLAKLGKDGFAKRVRMAPNPEYVSSLSNDVPHLT